MNWRINQFLSVLVRLSLSLFLSFSLSLYFSMESDYLELSQFPYNSHQPPYNSYPSPLGTFLTFGIRDVDFETSECDRRELWKEIQQMVNKVLEDVKDVSKKVKAWAESKKAMEEELSRLQVDLENMTEEELQSLDLMELEEQIKFQESTAVVASQDVYFWVKVDDDIHVHATLEVQSKEPKKKVMLIFQEPILDAPMEASIQESMIQELAIQVSVIQESKMQVPTILVVLESNEDLRIQEHSKVQRTNETLKIEKPLKA